VRENQHLHILIHSCRWNTAAVGLIISCRSCSVLWNFTTLWCEGEKVGLSLELAECLQARRPLLRNITSSTPDTITTRQAHTAIHTAVQRLLPRHLHKCLALWHRADWLPFNIV